MTVLGYTLDELRKSVVELIFVVAALLAFFITFDPALPEAAAAVVLAGFGVAAVYQAKGSGADITKALMALVTAGVALVGFFHEFKPGETEEIIAIAGAILNVGGVFFIRNRTGERQ